MGVKLSHIDKNLDLMTAAVGFVQSIAHSFEVKPRDVAEKMVEYFNKEEAADARRVSGGAGAVSQEEEEEKRNPGGHRQQG